MMSFVRSHSRRQKLALLSLLYFVQGLPFGFQSTALPVILRQQGQSLATIGLAQALALPWLFKIVWAPAVDRYFWPGVGRRRSWILPMQCLLAAACAAAAWAPTHLGALLTAVLFMNLFAATMDIAVDGLAIERLG